MLLINIFEIICYLYHVILCIGLGARIYYSKKSINTILLSIICILYWITIIYVSKIETIINFNGKNIISLVSIISGFFIILEIDTIREEYTKLVIYRKYGHDV